MSFRVTETNGTRCHRRKPDLTSERAAAPIVCQAAIAGAPPTTDLLEPRHPTTRTCKVLPISLWISDMFFNNIGDSEAMKEDIESMHVGCGVQLSFFSFESGN